MSDSEASHLQRPAAGAWEAIYKFFILEVQRFAIGSARVVGRAMASMEGLETVVVALRIQPNLQMEETLLI